MCKISIIIPVYNSEKHLRECLDSVLAQTYTGFEVLLIDDGSTDAGGTICEEYAVRDARFKVFHKENGGVSSARNLGIEKAIGEWITFVDSDDIIYSDYLENFIVIDNKNNLYDLVIQGYYRKKNKTLFKVNIGKGIVMRRDFSKLFEEYNIMNRGYVFSKFFKRNIINLNNIFFPIGVSLAEDLIFLIKYISHSSVILFDEKFSYQYNYVFESLSNSIQSSDVYINRYLMIKNLLKTDFQDVYENVYNKNSNLFDKISTLQFNSLLIIIKSFYYNRVKKEFRFTFYRNLMKDDLILLRLKLNTIDNFFLRCALTPLLLGNFKITDVIFKIYYKVKN